MELLNLNPKKIALIFNKIQRINIFIDR